jgi:hypothetical protein
MPRFIQTQCPARMFIAGWLMLTLLHSCSNKGQASPEGYDLNKPVRMELGKVLNEISGLTYDDAHRTLLAIADSKEKIFEINTRRIKLKDYSDKVVGPHTDLEDLVMIDSTIYLLGSAGILFEVRPRRDSVRQYPVPLSGKNDFETLYYDPSINSLILMCKTCEFEKGRGIRSAFRFDLSSKAFETTAFYTIKQKAVANLMKDEEIEFKPSAAAINPISKRLFILSSASNLLLIADNRGGVLEGYDLDPNLYPQAEGIAFAPNGDMYISNEAKYGNATLLLIPYHEPKNTSEQKSK